MPDILDLNVLCHDLFLLCSIEITSGIIAQLWENLWFCARSSLSYPQPQTATANLLAAGEDFDHELLMRLDHEAVSEQDPRPRIMY